MNQKILIVDDEPANLKLLGEILKDHYKLIFAKNGQEALKRVGQAPDLILLDIMMPEMDGLEVCRRLKAEPETSNIPVIFITAKREMVDELEGFAIGAADYIRKPFSGPVVKARVEAHLEIRRARKEIEHQNQAIKQQNEALIETAQLREDVERITRHDLKNPLQIIIAGPDMLLEEMELDSEHASILKAIAEAGYRMLDMINRSLDLYKMEKGSYQFSPVPFDLIVVLGRIAAELKQPLKNDNLTLNILLDGSSRETDDKFMVSGEELLCHSMLGNLIKNAIEASPADQAITVSLEKGNNATIKIHNKGSVPSAIRDRFFDKYATSGKKHGTGLGTYSASLLVKVHGGSIYLDTSDEDSTTIVVQLPR